jgi:hypothetical protein
LPVALVEGGRQRVLKIEDAWDVDDEWWRERIARRYYRVRLEDGAVRTVYRDEGGDEWFAQRY